jgi:hypothetical protein
MSKAEHLTTRATQLFALALQARRDGLTDYAGELSLEAQRELDAAIALTNLSAPRPLQDDCELGY